MCPRGIFFFFFFDPKKIFSIVRRERESEKKFCKKSARNQPKIPQKI